MYFKNMFTDGNVYFMCGHPLEADHVDHGWNVFCRVFKLYF